MARYALIRDGSIAEYREAEQGSPAHKLAPDGGPLLRPVIDPGSPAYNAALETVTQSTEITSSAVTWVYTVKRRSLEVQQQAVKQECQRRIIALTGAIDIIGCMLKQSNANMRANELNDKRIGGGVLTEAEAGEAAALRNLAVAIKALRAKSNEIETLDPIPIDYASDARWV